MSNLFENIALTDDTEIINHRKASAVANKRVKDRFGNFLGNAKGDLQARIALVEDDIHRIVQDVVAEHGGDPVKIEAAIKRSMNPMAIGPQGAPNPTNPAGGATCPQCGAPMVNGQCPTCQGGMGASGTAGAYGMMHSIPQAPSTGPITAAGGFCDTCKKWKSGPNKGCTCTGDDTSDVPEDSHEPDAERRQAEGSVHAQLSIDTEPIMHPRPLPDEPGEEGVTDIDGELAKAPSAVGTGTISRTAEALKTVDLPTGDESALGGPSPKIDKGNSGDQFGWSLDDIDTQMDGSPNPTIDQDPTDKADYNKEDFLDQTRAVTETETLPTDKGDAGYNTERNIPLQPTKTWNGTDGQHDPVTNQALSSWQYHGAVDPDKNPIRELMEEYSGHLMPNQVESAILDWSVG